MTSEESVSLKEHFEHRLDEMDKKLSDRTVSIERAVDKAEQALKERLAGMNELRETMRDQAANLATREQVALTAGAIEERLRAIENWSSNIQGPDRHPCWGVGPDCSRGVSAHQLRNQKGF